MMNYKYRFKNIHIFEYKSMERYFQQMAAQGWMLDKSRTWYFRFRACEPCKIYFHIGFDSKIGFTSLAYAEGTKGDYAAFMKSFGYSYISSIGIMQVFASEKDEPLFNEPEIDEQAFRSSVHKDEWSKTVIPFLFALFSTLVAAPLDLEVLSSNSNLLLAVFLIVLDVYLGVMMIPYLRYLLHHKIRDDLQLASLKYDMAVLIPLLVIYLLMYLLLPSNMFYALLILLFIIYIGRAGLHLAHRHGKHLTFWKIMVSACIALSFIALNLVFFKTPTKRTANDHPFMTAQDFGTKPKDAYFDSQASILLMRQEYMDQDMNYMYYEWMDTPLAEYCRDSILSRYQVKESAMKEVDGIKLYREPQTEDNGELVILMKKHSLMIFFAYEDAYFTFFKNHV